MRIWIAAALFAALAAPCAALGEGDDDVNVPQMQPASGLVLFYDSTGPMSFLSMTPKDVPPDARIIPEVRGVSCQRGLSVPIAASINATDVSGVYGDGSYAKALLQIQKANPEVAGIYDVRVDLEVFSILGLYKSTCTIVTARAFAPAASARPAPADPARKS